MNTFNAMSDLVADAGDLILCIGQSPDPELRLLKQPLAGLIEALRQRARQEIRLAGVARAPHRVTWSDFGAAPIIEVAVGLTVATLIYRTLVGRHG